MGCERLTYKKNKTPLKVAYSKTPFFINIGDSKKQGSPKKCLSAYKYKYNGKELQDELGLNLYSMDLRQYDPAIGRWTSIDPVTHHSMSTYTAFDNNPAFWADPSGADSIYNFDTGQYVINGKEVSQEEAIAYAQNGGNADGSNNNTVDGGSETGSSSSSSNSSTGIATNTSKNAGNNYNQDSCPKCPDKDKRKLAIMMANRQGGNAQDYYDALTNPDFVSNRINDNVTWLSAILTLVTAAPIVESLFTGGIKITFGQGANQIYHTFRHIEEAGLSRKIVQKAVQKSVNQSSKLIVAGKPFIKKIIVAGQQIEYTAYKLPNGLINVGRIVIPK